MHSFSHNFPINMKLEWRLMRISTFFPGFINCEVEFGLGEWMPLWMNLGVLH